MRRSPNCGQSSLHRQQCPGVLLTGGSRQLTHTENPLRVLDSAGAAVVDSQQRGAMAKVTGIDPLSRHEADAAEEGALRFG
jgi:hypothetical protein